MRFISRNPIRHSYKRGLYSMGKNFGSFNTAHGRLSLLTSGLPAFMFTTGEKKKKCSQKGLGLQKLYIGEILLMVKGSSGEKKKEITCVRTDG